MAAMRRALSVIAALAIGCSGGAPRADEGAGGEAVTLTRVRHDLVCTEEIPSGEAECAQRGCRWQAPLFCSGVEVPPETILAYQENAARPCTCVCRSDEIECMSRP